MRALEEGDFPSVDKHSSAPLCRLELQVPMLVFVPINSPLSHLSVDSSADNKEKRNISEMPW